MGGHATHDFTDGPYAGSEQLRRVLRLESMVSSLVDLASRVGQENNFMPLHVVYFGFFNMTNQSLPNVTHMGNITNGTGLQDDE